MKCPKCQQPMEKVPKRHKTYHCAEHGYWKVKTTRQPDMTNSRNWKHTCEECGGVMDYYNFKYGCRKCGAILEV